MRKIKVKIGFSNYSQSKFFFVASNIKTKMTGNPSFPSPTPNPDSLTEPLAAYGTLLEKGRTCTQAEIAAKEQLRVQITAILQSLGAFVQESGNNDRAILLTTGYELSEEPKPVGPLPAPEGLTVEKGLVSGSLDASVNKVAGSSGYLFAIRDAAVAGDDAWQITFSTKTKFTFTGLTQGKQYLVRVCAKGANPSCAYTEPLAVWAS